MRSGSVFKMQNYSGDGDVLDKARSDIFHKFLPIIICMIVFGAAGIVGNILAFIFYAFKTKRATTVVLIACLALVDLTVCVLFVPNIIEMWINVTYTQSFICKLAHFIGLWAVACSSLILWVVAIDRHRKICFPFGRQITLKTSKYVVIGIVVFGLLLSVRNFANFETVAVNVKLPGYNGTVTGRYCTTRDDSSYIASVTVFTVIDFLLMLMVWFTLAVAYSLIIYTLFKLRKTRRQTIRKPDVTTLNFSNPSYSNGESRSNDSHESASSVSEAACSGDCEKEAAHEAQDHATESKQSDIEAHVDANPVQLCDIKRTRNKTTRFDVNSFLIVLKNKIKSDTRTEMPGTHESVTQSCSEAQYSQSGDHLPTVHSSSLVNEDCGTVPSEHTSKTQGVKSQSMKHRKYNSAKSARERSLTFKMFTVSVVFVLCFTPYFIVKIFMREVLKTGEEFELSLLSQIALRLPYMNSVFNPIVYCVFNSQFRLYIKGVFVGLISRKFLKRKYLM